MRIAVIGAGAMGSIYGGRLSQKNEVYLVDTNTEVVNAINSNGLILEENGQNNKYNPKAVTSTANLEPVDLIILFVKALYSRSALAGNKNLIGSHTYLMTLQNGSGHEDILSDFAPKERIIIGTTEDNGAVLSAGHVRHGGKGNTNVGMLVPDSENFLLKLKNSFDECGFNVRIHENIQQLIWNKLFALSREYNRGQGGRFSVAATAGGDVECGGEKPGAPVRSPRKRRLRGARSRKTRRKFLRPSARPQTRRRRRTR